MRIGRQATVTQMQPGSYDDLWWFANHSEPLFAYDAPSDAKLGQWTAQGNEHDPAPGPMHYWHRVLPSGMHVVLQRAHDTNHYPEVHVFADRLDIDKVISELNLPYVVAWRADTAPDDWRDLQTRYRSAYSWNVVRQDGHGNAFVVRAGLCEGAAMRIARDLESDGHRQTYWVVHKPAK